MLTFCRSLLLLVCLFPLVHFSSNSMLSTILLPSWSLTAEENNVLFLCGSAIFRCSFVFLWVLYMKLKRHRTKYNICILVVVKLFHYYKFQTYKIHGCSVTVVALKGSTKTHWIEVYKKWSHRKQDEKCEKIVNWESTDHKKKINHSKTINQFHAKSIWNLHGSLMHDWCMGFRIERSVWLLTYIRLLCYGTFVYC